MMYEQSSPVSDRDITDAYTYLLSRFLVVRQEHTDRAADGFAYNKILYNPLGSADFVNPNLDVAYFEAWFAVDDDTPVVLEGPEIIGRYYTAQLVDEWGEVICNINERVTPARPHGRFALTKPGSRPDIPSDATRLDLHGSKAKLLGRVELQADPDQAVLLQRAFTSRPLGDVTVADPPVIPPFDNATLLGVEIFEYADAVLASALDVSPAAAALQLSARAIARRIAVDPAERERIDLLLHEHVPKLTRTIITDNTPYFEGWSGGAPLGNYGASYSLRTMANYAGIWANTSSETVYFGAGADIHGNPMDGSATYDLHFDAHALPDDVVDAYWSVILVSVPSYRVVPNPLHRYNLNSYSPLERNADGSLTIVISPEEPAGSPSANWLPTAPGQPFTLTFRAYGPRGVVPFGPWRPPGLRRRT